MPRYSLPHALQAHIGVSFWEWGAQGKPALLLLALHLLCGSTEEVSLQTYSPGTFHGN